MARSCAVADLVLELLLLLLLQDHLLLIELLDGSCVDISIKVRTVEEARFSRFLDPEVFGRFEVIPENGDDFLNLII